MKRYVLILMVLALPVILIGAPAAAQTEPAGNWLHFGYDAAYTAYSPGEHLINPTNVANLEFKWGIGCGDGMFSVISRSPAIYDGKLFVAPAGQGLSLGKIEILVIDLNIDGIFQHFPGEGDTFGHGSLRGAMV